MKITSLLAATLTAASAWAAESVEFNTYFTDSTLRLDYRLGGTADSKHIDLDRQIKSAGWAGRRTRLAELPLLGNGIVTVTDIASGDTIYTTSFSTLFSEWLETDEAQTTPRSMQAVQLVPLPKAAAEITTTILNSRHKPIASMTHTYRPDDELVAQAVAEPFPYRCLHRGGSPEEAIDVAILAEGYTEAEMDSFYRHAQIAVDEILRYEPFASRADRFNFVAVASPSAESGVSVPRLNDWKNTAFSSHFSTFYSDRYLTTGAISDVHNALTGIPYEHIIILANTDEYGGGGIYNSYTLTAARHPLFRPVVVHEFGHSFGGLADEYFYENDVMTDTYPLDVEPWEPNITTLQDFDSKWKPLLKNDTPVPTPVADKDKYPVGVYEGGGYSFKGVYRPADECRMRNNTYPTFCPACANALATLIDFYR